MQFVSVLTSQIKCSNGACKMFCDPIYTDGMSDTVCNGGHGVRVGSGVGGGAAAPGRSFSVCYCDLGMPVLGDASLVYPATYCVRT